MKKPRSKKELLVDYAIQEALKIGLTISLTILWGLGEWPLEALNEFKDRYFEWIDAWNNRAPDLLDLVNEMKEDTGIDI